MKKLGNWTRISELRTIHKWRLLEPSEAAVCSAGTLATKLTGCSRLWMLTEEYSWVGTTVFRDKFCQIPRRHLPNSAGHRSKFLEFRGSPRPPTLESLCRLWPSYKLLIINSSTARIYWCKICNKIWISHFSSWKR